MQVVPDWFLLRRQSPCSADLIHHSCACVLSWALGLHAPASSYPTSCSCPCAGQSSFTVSQQGRRSPLSPHSPPPRVSAVPAPPSSFQASPPIPSAAPYAHAVAAVVGENTSRPLPEPTVPMQVHAPPLSPQGRSPASVQETPAPTHTAPAWPAWPPPKLALSTSQPAWPTSQPGDHGPIKPQVIEQRGKPQDDGLGPVNVSQSISPTPVPQLGTASPPSSAPSWPSERG